MNHNYVFGQPNEEGLSYSNIIGIPNLAAVAYSGSFTDLTNKPDIATTGWTLGTGVTSTDCNVDIKGKCDIKLDLNVLGEYRKNGVILNGSPWTTSTQSINYDKNVGIGITTPSPYKLSVDGDINYTGNLRLNGVVQTFASPPTGWTFSGNTTSTEHNVLVKGTLTTAKAIGFLNAKPGDMVVNAYSGTDRYGIGQYANGVCRIFANTGFSVRVSTPTDSITGPTAGFKDHLTVLTGSGFVGVGTTSPGYWLSVDGDQGCEFTVSWSSTVNPLR